DLRRYPGTGGRPAFAPRPGQCPAGAVARRPWPGDGLDPLAGRDLPLRPRRRRLDPGHALHARAWRREPRYRQPQHHRAASDHRHPRPCPRPRAGPDPCPVQPRAVRARLLPVPLLRPAVPAPTADPRPRHPALARRPGHLGERGQRLLPLQLAQEQPHPAPGQHAAAGGALPAKLDRAPDPVQPQHPGRPAGIPARTAAAPLQDLGTPALRKPPPRPRSNTRIPCAATDPRRRGRTGAPVLGRPGKPCLPRHLPGEENGPPYGFPAPMIDSQRYPRLASIDSPVDLRRFDEAELPAVAQELRGYLIESVGRSGGHFGAGLGVVELTVALHYLYDTPGELLVWDVGHQTYPHKILTGRRDRIHTVKQKDGVAPFPKREESEYD